MNLLNSFSNFRSNFVNLITSFWTKLGNDIDGEFAGDQSGVSVAINGAGDKVVIGAKYNPSGSGPGHARVYSWNGSSWIQFGPDIDAPYLASGFGHSVSINDAGNAIAIGSPNSTGGFGVDDGRVNLYTYNGATNTWSNTEIAPLNAQELLGFCVSMNSDGSRIAVSAINSFDGGNTNVGVVRIYNSAGNRVGNSGIYLYGWNNGGGYGDYFGYSCCISGAGDRVVISNPQGGQTFIYYYNGTIWAKLGGTIAKGTTVQTATPGYGGVSINYAGDRVAIGIYQTGKTAIYSWDGSSWSQLGSDISAGGACVSLNSAGDKVIIGTRLKAVIYSWDGATWSQLGSDINAETVGDIFGCSVTINNDGNKIGIGAIQNDGNGSNSGSVRVYSS